jgi:RNA polymerase sigma factor (sigma-70 family)
MLGSGPDAEDAAQATFVLLTRKAGQLAGAPDLGAWLHRSARLVSRTALRARRRRLRHEREAAMAVVKGSGTEQLWRRYADRLDAALDSLPAACRQALVLCYFEGLSQREAAERLSVPESTLSSRCTRGLEKLRARLGVRERRLGAAGLGALLAGHAGQSLPDSFVVSAVSAAKGAAASAPVLALTEGALTMMFWSKLKATGLWLTAAAVLAAATPLAVVAASGEKQPPPEAVKGLRVTLTAGKTAFLPGEKVKLRLTFENVSREKLRVFLAPANWLGHNLSWEVRGPGARRVMAARGAMARLPILADYPELQSGAKRTVELQLGGNPPTLPGWQLTAPGEYRISVAYGYAVAGPVHHQGKPVSDPVRAPGPAAPRRAAPAAERGPRPVPGRIWKGTVSSNALKLSLGKPDPAKGVDGLAVRISADRRSAKPGEEVSLKVTFKNVSAAAMKVCAYNLEGQVRITGPDAEAAVLALRMMRTRVWRPQGPVAANFHELAPGAERSFTVKVAGNPPSLGAAGSNSRTFLTKPGEYTVSLRYRNTWTQCASVRPGGGRTRVRGKVWTGSVESAAVKIGFEGQFKAIPAGWRKAGRLGPGLMIPGRGGGAPGQGRVPTFRIPEKKTDRP